MMKFQACASPLCCCIVMTLNSSFSCFFCFLHWLALVFAAFVAVLEVVVLAAVFAFHFLEFVAAFVVVAAAEGACK